VALDGIRRLVAQIKAVEKEDLVPDAAERAHVEGAGAEDRALRLRGQIPRERRPPVVQPQLILQGPTYEGLNTFLLWEGCRERTRHV